MNNPNGSEPQVRVDDHDTLTEAIINDKNEPRAEIRALVWMLQLKVLVHIWNRGMHD